jgi:hypothetical protein
MANKGWFIGCGTMIAAVIIAVVFAVGYFARRAAGFTHQLETARERYVAVNRDFPFKIPERGEFSAERFERYLKVRMAVNDAIAPLSKSNGPLDLLSALSGLAEEVSRAQANALREKAMSVDEYRWISRQVYTTIAAEPSQPDPDPTLVELRRTLQQSPRQSSFQLSNRSSSNQALDPNLLDFTWLRVPESTRAIVRQHAAEIARMRGAAIADSFLIQIEFEPSRGS